MLTATAGYCTKVLRVTTHTTYFLITRPLSRSVTVHGIQLCRVLDQGIHPTANYLYSVFEMAAVRTIFNLTRCGSETLICAYVTLFSYKHLFVRDWVNKLFLFFILSLVWINLNIIIHIQYKGVDRWVKILKLYFFCPFFWYLFKT